MDYQEKLDNFLNIKWGTSEHKLKSTAIINALVKSNNETDFYEYINKFITSFSRVKDEIDWLSLKYDDYLKIFKYYDDYSFIFPDNESFMTPFFINKMVDLELKDHLSPLLKIYFVNDESIKILLNEFIISNAKIITNMFNQRETDKRYDSSYNIKKKFKTKYFKDMIDKYGEEFASNLDNKDKQTLFMYWKRNIFTAKLSKINDIFKDIVIDEEYIRRNINSLFKMEVNKQYVATQFEIYFENIDNKTLINILKEKEFDYINPYIIPYLFKRDVLKEFDVSKINSHVSELSSSDKIKIWKESESQNKKEEWNKYIFNSHYLSNIDYISLYKVNPNFFNEKDFLENSKKEFKDYVEDTFYKNFVTYFINEEEDKNKTKRNILKKFFEKMKEIDLYDEDKIIKISINNFAKFNNTEFGRNINFSQRVQKRYMLLKEILKEEFNILPEKIRVTGILNPNHYNSNYNSFFRSFVEKEMLKENLPSINETKNINISKRRI